MADRWSRIVVGLIDLGSVTARLGQGAKFARAAEIGGFAASDGEVAL